MLDNKSTKIEMKTEKEDLFGSRDLILGGVDYFHPNFGKPSVKGQMAF